MKKKFTFFSILIWSSCSMSNGNCPYNKEHNTHTHVFVFCTSDCPFFVTMKTKISLVLIALDLYIYLSIGEAEIGNLRLFSHWTFHAVDKGLRKLLQQRLKNETYSRAWLTSWCSYIVHEIFVYLWHTHFFIYVYKYTKHTYQCRVRAGSRVCVYACCWNLNPSKTRIKFFATEFLSLWDYTGFI